MVIIADSGATKTDWFVCSGERCDIIRTEGINASTMDEEAVESIVARFASRLHLPENVKLIRFYGAGLLSKESCNRVKQALERYFPGSKIVLKSDLGAASEALFPEQSGEYVAAILGTGSNSCLYRDGIPVRNIRPGGFILGDEGSGASLGKLLLSDYFKGLVPEDLSKKMEERFDLRYEVVVEQVYRGATPSRYLASFAPFLLENLDNEYVLALVEGNLRSFIERVLVQYECSRIGIAGGLGYACKDILSRLGAGYGLHFERFVKSPVEVLAGQSGKMKEQNNGI